MMATAHTAGDVLPFSILIYDSNNALANATSVTVTIYKPDGTTAGPFSVSPSTTGTYRYDYTTDSTLPGRYMASWAASGTQVGNEPDAKWVLNSLPIVTLNEIKAHLEITGTEDDDELMVTVAAAIPIIESMSGPLSPTARVKKCNGGSNAILLTDAPIASVTSIVESGTTLASTDYVADLANGVVYRGVAGGSYFTAGINNVTISYVAGTSPTANQQYAVKELVKYLWRQTKGNPQSFQDGFVPVAATAGLSAAMVARLRMILGSSRRGPAVS